MADSTQQTLGFERVDPDLREVPLDEIQPTTGAKTAEVQASIETFGITSTPLLQEVPDTMAYAYRIVDGERRIHVARQSDEREAINAYILPQDRGAEADALTFVHNLARSPSPLDEAEAIADLLASGYSKEALTQLNVPKQTIEKRIRLSQAPQAIKDAVGDGDIAEGVAERVANLSIEQQNLCVEFYRDQDHLRHKDVDSIKSAKRTADAEALPDDLFDTSRDPAGHDPSTGDAPTKDAYDTEGFLASEERWAQRVGTAVRDALEKGVPPGDIQRVIRVVLDKKGETAA